MRRLREMWFRFRGQCPECRMKNQVHKMTCSRRSGPGRRLWAQSG